METVAIGVGGNIGDASHQVVTAMSRVWSELELTEFKMSSLYCTAPVGPVEQPDFINAVCVGLTPHSPEDVLKKLQRIELEMGRKREVHWGPRTIDLDILFMGSKTLNLNHLVLPHPEMHCRGFVLVPLAEIFSEWVHPSLELSVIQLLEKWERSRESGEAVHLLDPTPIEP